MEAGLESEKRCGGKAVCIKEYLNLHEFERVAYLKVETSGLLNVLGNRAEITAISVYDGKTLRTYAGESINHFKEDIREFEAVVTFKGDQFDLKALSMKFEINWEELGIKSFDLSRLNFDIFGKKSQTLASVKTKLKIANSLLRHLDGKMAELLWKKYKYESCTQALKMLMAYNADHAVALKFIAETCIQELKRKYNKEDGGQSVEFLRSVEEEGRKVLQSFYEDDLKFDISKVPNLLASWGLLAQKKWMEQLKLKNKKRMEQLKLQNKMIKKI